MALPLLYWEILVSKELGLVSPRNVEDKLSLNFYVCFALLVSKALGVVSPRICTR